MGFFSQKTTQVESTSVLLFQDTPNLVRDSVYLSVMHDRPIADDLAANYFNSVAVRAEAMYKYGKDTYVHGLPQGTTEYLRAGDTAVKLVIERDLGQLVYITYSTVEPCTANYTAEQFMAANRGWQYGTLHIPQPPFTPVDPTAQVSFHDAYITGTNTIKIEYSYTDARDPAAPVVVYANESVTTTDTFEIGAMYYYASYYALDSRLEYTGERQYYSYNTNAGTEPMLDKHFTKDKQSPYYPIIPLRQNNVDLTAISLKGTPAYDTSRKCLQKLGLKIEDLGEAINGSPDVDSVDHAFVAIAVHLQSDVQNTMQYLHAYFAHLHDIAEYDEQDHLYWAGLNNAAIAPPTNMISIEDAQLRVDVAYTYITKQLVTGVTATKIGDVTRTSTVLPRVNVIKVMGTDASGNDILGSAGGWEQSYVTFRKQVSATQYEEIKVHGLIHINHVYQHRTVEATIADSLTTDNDDFWIPVNIVVSKGLGVLNHNSLLYDAIRMVFNCIEITKLKWYQTTLFQAIVMVIAIVLTVWSLGSMGASLTWAAGLVGSSNLWIGALVLVGINIAIQVGFSMLVNVLGIESALVLATIAIIGSMFMPGNVPVGIQGATFADALMFAGQSLVLAIQDAQIEALDAIAGEARVLEESQTILQAELDATWEDINGSYGINPMAAIRWTSAASIDSMESPTEFYHRTSHAGNAGVRALDEIESFVDERLKLEGVNTLQALKL